MKLEIDALHAGIAGRIRVVDDEAAIRTMLAQFLTEKRYLVLCSENGVDALQTIATHQDIDVVLLDINMPEMGGMEVLANLAKHRARPPVIVLSSMTERQIAHSVLKMGAFDYILKPFDLHAVESTVSAAISLRSHSQPWWKVFSA